ncbi:uncharacterized protein LOC110859781 [Folsomia candida]|nr:uncharacterized protein LOC110859781 [Folsomia candida]
MQGQNMRPYRDSAGWINMPSLGPPPSAAGPAEGNSGPPRRREYTFDVPDVNLYEPLIGIPPGSPVIDVWDGPVAALWQGGRGQEADEHNLVQSAGPSEGDSLPAGRPKKRKSRRESWEDERWQNVAGIPPPAPATVTPRRVPPSAAAGRRDGGPERLVFRDEDVGPLEGVSTRHLTRTPLAPLSRQGPSAAAGRRGGMERLEFSNDDDNNFLSSSYGPSVGRSAGDENPPLPRKRRRIIAGGQENQREVARSLPHSTTTR